MKVGFTGTRSGMTAEQKATVLRLLTELKPDTVHHGDCLGADSDFADICAALIPRPWIIAHPGESAKGGANELRAFNANNDEVMPVRTHFARNREIVKALRDIGDTLIATPFQSERQTNGGTWYTVDFAEKQAKRVVIVWPNGTTNEEGDQP